jgi:competence protein ComEC
MNGKYFYFAITALLGVLSSLVHFLLFFLLTALFLFLLYKYKRYTNRKLLLIIGTFLIFWFLGNHDIFKNKTAITETTNSFFLEFNENTKIDGDLLQVLATEERFKEKLLIRYKITSEQEKLVLKNTSFYGHRCEVTGELSKPSIAKNPNAFNYRNYLAAKQVFWIVEIQENPLRKCTPIKQNPIMMIKQLRFSGINYLENHFPPEIASLSAALIFGDRSLLDPDVLINYQKTGIVHLLAISGLHVSLLIGMIYYLGIRLGVTRQFMMNFLLLILPIYAILTGGSPSVIRSVMMIFLVLITLKWQIQLKLLAIDAISIAFVIYLFFSPMIIYDAGFQLSFSVSFAIILSVSYILPRYQSYIVGMIATSVIAQLAALPILLYHFFEISFISIVANLLYIPLFSFIFLPGLYLVFFIQVIFKITPIILIHLLLKIISLSNGLVDLLAAITFARFIPGRPNLLYIFVYVLLILLIFLIWETGLQQKGKRRIRQIILIVVVLVTFQNGWNFINPFGEVTMIDVGQGDSILIHYPFGKGTYLIDTGGTVQFNEEEWKKDKKPYEVGRDVVVPYLKGKGITKIDKLILTHGDMDHIGGTFSILKELEVKQILMPSVAEPSETEMKIIQKANEKDIEVVRVSEGSHWKNGKNLFHVLAPEQNYKGERNSGSIALFAQVGGLNWFFGGDLDQEGEEKIISKYHNLNIDVLKAGHHGSNTSSSKLFVSKLNPKVALISVGEGNRYGHPHEEVLDRLKNAAIYRTDLQGAITYRFYQDKGTFSSYLP